MSNLPQTNAAVAYQLMLDLLHAENKSLRKSKGLKKATRQEVLQAYRDAITETLKGKKCYPFYFVLIWGLGCPK